MFPALGICSHPTLLEGVCHSELSRDGDYWSHCESRYVCVLPWLSSMVYTLYISFVLHLLMWHTLIQTYTHISQNKSLNFCVRSCVWWYTSACECGGQRATSEVSQTPATFFWHRISCRPGTHQADRAGQRTNPKDICLHVGLQMSAIMSTIFIWALGSKALYQISYNLSLDFKLLTEFNPEKNFMWINILYF